MFAVVFGGGIRAVNGQKPGLSDNFSFSHVHQIIMASIKIGLREANAHRQELVGLDTVSFHPSGRRGISFLVESMTGRDWSWSSITKCQESHEGGQ